ncbi:hypothetical protein [Halovulum sp. GXIMD14793]
MTCSVSRVVAFCAALFPISAIAQSEDTPHVSVELNASDPVDTGCRISFVIQNSHATDIEKAVYEAVLFDTEGRVDRLTLFDFGNLPSNRPRVRQFVVPDLNCADLGRLLINGSETCDGAGLAPDACTRGLELKSRTKTEVIG